MSRKKDPESEWKHGTDYTYRYRECRCIVCVHHNAAKSWARRHNKPKEEYSGPTPKNYEHGTRQKYNVGCNCNFCTVAHRKYIAEQERIKKFRSQFKG